VPYTCGLAERPSEKKEVDRRGINLG